MNIDDWKRSIIDVPTLIVRIISVFPKPGAPNGIVWVPGSLYRDPCALAKVVCGFDTSIGQVWLFPSDPRTFKGGRGQISRQIVWDYRRSLWYHRRNSKDTVDRWIEKELDPILDRELPSVLKMHGFLD